MDKNNKGFFELFFEIVFYSSKQKILEMHLIIKNCFLFFVSKNINKMFLDNIF